MLIYILFLFFILWSIRFYFRNKRAKDLINKIPGPPTLPIIGNLLMFNVSIENLWNVLRDLNKRYYPITKFWLGFIPMISVHHPDDLEILLSSMKHIDKGSSYKYLHPWFKTGLLTSSGEKWKHRRQILTPAFHFNILKKYTIITNDNSKMFIRMLKTQKDESVHNLLSLCSNYTLNTICETAMGVALDKIDAEIAKQYKNAVNEVGNIVIYRAIRPYIQDWMLNPLMQIARKQKQSLKIFRDFSNKVLIERKAHKQLTNAPLKDLNKSSKSHNYEDTFFGDRKKLAMLDLLLEAEKRGLIDDNGIKEEIGTFMLAGHDTTGMALVYVIMLLAENSEYQDKARSEVITILNRSKGEIRMEEIRDLHYLERCIKESLRLFPPVSALSRCLKEDLKLKDYVIPAGTEIGCHIFDVHRDPNFWPEPEKFDPDRFLPERIQGRHPFSYIPFSAGPRNCIGQRFALMEMKSLMAHILYNFKLEPVSRTSDIKLLLNLVTQPSKPVHTRFIRIDNNNEHI
ncbi:PREDICTED: cytochrome P450 4C1-like [Ceratosolen solmsi marchali]|uniref:Cytochrome P450 4C1-like n=1 Tax=Ceratosolen solmsi marchali TaxID=326594 RepID=A0AAJ6YUT6_9HYME|nr:PREDICTED: cytochrome P450 4C1-like [Ceratosolen solmsi marchali]